MKVVRKGVFETNSSSTHSIGLIGGTYTPDKFHTEDGVCKVYPGEFGWERIRFHSSEIKASYCLTYIMTLGGQLKIALEKMLINVMKVVTECENVEFVPCSTDEEWEHQWGYIDHQSASVCSEAFASESSLRDFIFNPQSHLQTGNDNGYCREDEDR